MAKNRGGGSFKNEPGYTEGNYGRIVPENYDGTPGRPDLGEKGLHYENKEFMKRDTARIAEQAADPHEHHAHKHHSKRRK